MRHLVTATSRGAVAAILAAGALSSLVSPRAAFAQREANRVLEERAWGGYRTEFYPTYDYKPIAEAQRKSVK